MKRAKSDYPKTIREGSVTVKVYRVRNYESVIYQVVYYLGSERTRATYSDEATALEEAGKKAKFLAQGQANELTLNGTDCDSYMAARELLREIGGVPLASAVDEYVRARKLLGSRSLITAVEQWLADHAPSLAVATVPQIVEECIKAKTAVGLSESYMRPFSGRLRRFARSVRGNIGDVKQVHIEAYLNGTKTTGRTRNNIAQAIRTFFNFAKARGYLHRERKTEADFIEMKPEKESDTAIYTVDELARMLVAGDADSVPFIAIGAFSGIRSFEMKRLDWSNFRWDQGVIEIKGGKAKTGSRRNAPLHPILAEWLMPYQKAEGFVCRCKKAEMVARARVIKAGLKWKKNALRHSFDSYRLAELKDASKVSYEMGNSPRMVFKHYHELVAPKEAERFWSLTPAAAKATVDAAAKPTPMPTPAPVRNANAPAKASA